MKKKTILIILDGLGVSSVTTDNPLKTTYIPCIEKFLRDTKTLLVASGSNIGLPEKQMGNSEVGHIHIGAGREILQDITRINKDIETGEFFNNPVFLEAIQEAKSKNRKIHVIGLLSPGGVHSHEKHIQAFIDLIIKKGVKNYYFHAILDGRDSPPKSAMSSIKRFKGKISSITGRYYAMDRDKRWSRTKMFYDLIVHGKCSFIAESPEEGLNMSYERGETDEFVQPTFVAGKQQEIPNITENDVVFFMNFRSDRVKQISYALQSEFFSGFDRIRGVVPKFYFTLTKYAEDIKAPVAFPSIHTKNTLGEVISEKKLHQLRLSETEKYAHVTYFFNGGKDVTFKYEDRILIDSKKVKTYDLKPEMSAFEITESLIKAIKSDKYSLIICNYANLDMVGHTGLYIPAEKSLSTIDKCMEQVIEEAKEKNFDLIITSDHGNIEAMYNEEKKQAHTSHTTNLVPFIYVGKKGNPHSFDGDLRDIAPTILNLLDIKPPQEMTGKSLI